MTSSTADRGRRRARAATWTLVIAATTGATAVAGVAAASTPTGHGTEHPDRHRAPLSRDMTHRRSAEELGREHADGEHEGQESGEEQTPTSPARHQRHHRHSRAWLSAPTSSQPSATSSGS
jgi:hypothetical protein